MFYKKQDRKREEERKRQKRNRKVWSVKAHAIPLNIFHSYWTSLLYDTSNDIITDRQLTDRYGGVTHTHTHCSMGLRGSDPQ